MFILINVLIKIRILPANAVLFVPSFTKTDYILSILPVPVQWDASFKLFFFNFAPERT
jgi:hypothetical protein